MFFRQIDNKGNHLLVSEEASINVPAIAAAHVTKRYTAQATDELTFEVTCVWGPAGLLPMPSALTRFLSLRDPGGGHRVSHRHAPQRRHGMVAREAWFPGERRHFLAAGLVTCVPSSSSLSSAVGVRCST